MATLRVLALAALLLAPGLAAAQKITVDRDAYLARCAAQLYPLDDALLNNLATVEGFGRVATGYLLAARDVCGCGFAQAEKALNARRLLLFAHRGFEPIDEGLGQVFDAADRDAVDRFEKEHRGYRQCAENFERRVRQVAEGAQ